MIGRNLSKAELYLESPFNRLVTYFFQASLNVAYIKFAQRFLLCTLEMTISPRSIMSPPLLFNRAQHDSGNKIALQPRVYNENRNCREYNSSGL